MVKIDQITISIRCNNGKFVIIPKGNAPLICSTGCLNNSDQFTIEIISYGQVALKSNGKYVSSENGEQPITCNRSKIGEWEIFGWISNKDGTFSLKGNNGKFISGNEGMFNLTCCSDKIGVWEKFHAIGRLRNFVGKVVSFKGCKGKFISSNNGDRLMECNRTDAKEWEKFFIEDVGDNKIALKYGEQYVSSENGQKPLFCDRTILDEWEKFELIQNDDGTVSFKGSNGKYISFNEHNGIMSCCSDEIGSCTKFEAYGIMNPIF